MTRHARAVVRFLIALSFAAVCWTGAQPVAAEEPATAITADRLQYFAETGKYVASGSVQMKKNGTVMTCDEMTYDEKTTDVVASGNVRYYDAEVSIQAAKAELRMDNKTGKLYDSIVFFRKDHTYLKGKEIEKRGEFEYYTPEASFTTCDAPVPAWCFRGKEVHTVLRESFAARDVTFRIKDLPVFYAPYLKTSLEADRQTGFLLPVAGYSKTNGVELTLPFYWNIAENRDVTVVLDAFSKRGLGAGLEYRFIEPSGVQGNLWAYHIRDTELNRDFTEVKGIYEARKANDIGGYLNINYVNQQDFYQQFSLRREIRVQRFLESTGEAIKPLPDGRLYLLSQYWVDLKNATGDAPQRLPELGYVLNYISLGGLKVAAQMSASNIWRENGLSAERFDIYPRVLYSFGSDVVVSQAAAVRGTAYSYYRTHGTDDNTFRSAFEYDVNAHTRLYKRYGSFTHVIEPFLGFHYVSSSKNDLPVFDSAEAFGKTSVVELGLLNRGISSGSELFLARLTQALDTNGGNRPFLPLHLEAVVRTPVAVGLEATYDYYSGNIETLTADVGFRVFKTELAVGQRFNRKDNIMIYTGAASFSPNDYLRLTSQIWYDAKGQGLRDLTVNLKYQKQCWGIRVEAVKRPGDFTMRVFFDIVGLNSKMSVKESPADARTYF